LATDSPYRDFLKTDKMHAIVT